MVIAIFMTPSSASRWYSPLLVGTTLLTVAIKAAPVKAQQMYNPIPLSGNNKEFSSQLSKQDIPTGEGGFARDYQVKLKKGDQIAIDLISEDFDAMVQLIASDGTIVAENDDGPEGTTNSLLFIRIANSGEYIVRVRAFGKTGGGDFTLKINHLQPSKE